MPHIAVIIVTHNSERFLPNAIASLEKQIPHQLIIVDSGSTNKEYLSPYPVIHNSEDIGFAVANNIGYSHISPQTDYVLFLNPDAFLTPDFLLKAVQTMEKNPSCGGLTGLLLGYDIDKNRPTEKVDSAGIFHTWYGKWYDREQGKPYHPSQFKTEEVPAICAASLFCRRKALDSILLREKEVLDSTFYMYKEDIELSLRLKKKGWNLLFDPSLITHHCRGWHRDRSKMPRKLRLCSSRNELRIHLRYHHPIGVLYSMLKHAAVKIIDL